MRSETIVFLLIILLFYSCEGKKEKIENILSNRCYWDVVDKGSIHPVNSCFNFTESGECHYFYYIFRNRIRTDSIFSANDGDNVFPNTWKVVKDSIIIRSVSYHILEYNQDSIFLTATGTDLLTLIKNCKVK
jgi:hypothetical protein